MFACKELKKQDNDVIHSDRNNLHRNQFGNTREGSLLRTENFLARNLGNSYMQASLSNRLALPKATDSSGVLVAAPVQAVPVKDEHKRIQTKLKVGPANDVYEREADRVADQVMQMSESVVQAENEQSSLGMYIHRISSGGNAGFDAGIKLNQSGGRSLSAGTRNYMEPRLGVDFSHVRLHTDHQAQENASQIQAKAFTYGNNIWLGKGAVEGDRRLMAHELTHVVQQHDTLSSKQPIIQAKLCVRGAASDDLLTRLLECSTHMPTLRKVSKCSECSDAMEVEHDPGPFGGDIFTMTLGTILHDRNSTLCFKGVRNDASVVEDSWDQKAFDLGDNDMFPMNPPSGRPSATTRCQTVLHAITEFWHGASTAAGYDASHNVGIATENLYRSERGQSGSVVRAVFVPPDRARIEYSNGASHEIRIVGGNVASVTFTEPASP